MTFKPAQWSRKLRSQEWYGGTSRDSIEIARRLAAWPSPVEAPESGYGKLFQDHVQGADTGTDFDFLRGCRGAPVPEDSH